MNLTWKPETGLPVVSSSAKGRSLETATKLPPTIWQREKEQIDGILVPPVDPSKQKKKLQKNQTKNTAGSNWFHMQVPTVTPELKKELQLLKLRNVLDPKRHYKASDSKDFPKVFQVGTVIAGPADFYSGRLTKKERKLTFADELLSNTSLKTYAKRKYLEIQDRNQAGKKNFWKKKKNYQKPSWAKI